MSATVTQTLSTPTPVPARPAPKGNSASSTTTRGTRSETVAPKLPERGPPPQLPGSSAPNANDRVTLKSADPRSGAQEVQATGQNITKLQSAGQQVDSGIKDLQRLGSLAKQSAGAPPTTDRKPLNDEAKAIGNRLAKTDSSPDVEAARAQVRQSALQQNANDAKGEATKRTREAVQLRQEAAKAPPTLVLEPRQNNVGEADQKANEARRDASRAQEAVVENRRTVQSAKEDAQRQRAATTLKPTSTDVSNPDAAQKTAKAAEEAQNRAISFRAGISQAEGDASKSAREATTKAGSEAAAKTGSPAPAKLRSENEGQQTAERVRQAAQANPQAFIASQARVSSDAAARLLS